MSSVLKIISEKQTTFCKGLSPKRNQKISFAIGQLFIYLIFSCQSNISPPNSSSNPPTDPPVVPGDYTVAWQNMLGGNQSDDPTTMVILPDGSSVIAGSTQSDLSGDVPSTKGYSDIWIIKVSAGGGLIWSKCFGGSGYESASKIIATKDGGFAIVCSVSEPNKNQDGHDGDITGYHGTWSSDLWIIKIDAKGNALWNKAFGGTGDEAGGSLVEMDNGELIVGGSTNSTDGDLAGIHSFGDTDAWLFKLDINQNIVWQKKMGGSKPEAITSMTRSTGGGILLAAHTQSNDGEVVGSHVTPVGPGVISGDFWIIKLDEGGSVIWKKAFGGSHDDWPFSLIELNDKTIVVSGSTQSSDGDITGYHNYVDHGVSNTTSDAWIVKLKSNGELMWEKSFGGSGSEGVFSSAATNSNSVVFFGFADSNDGDVSGNHGGTDIWILQLSADNQTRWQKCFGGTGFDYGGDISATADGVLLFSGSSTSNDGDITSSHGQGDFWVVQLSPK